MIQILGKKESRSLVYNNSLVSKHDFSVRTSAHTAVPKYDRVYRSVLNDRLGLDINYQNRHALYKRVESRRYKSVPENFIPVEFSLEQQEFPCLPIKVKFGDINLSIIGEEISSNLVPCTCSAPYFRCKYSPKFYQEMLSFVMKDSMCLGERIKKWFLTFGCKNCKNIFLFLSVQPQGAAFGAPLKHQHDHVHRGDPMQIDEILHSLNHLTVEHRVPLFEGFANLFKPFSQLLDDKTFPVYLLCLGVAMLTWHPTMSKTTKNFFFGTIASIVILKIGHSLPTNLYSVVIKWLGDFVSPQGPDEAFGLIVQAVSGLVFCSQIGFKDVSTFGNSFQKMVSHSTTFAKSMDLFKEWFLKLIVGIATEFGWNLTYLLNKNEAAFKSIQLRIHQLIALVEDNEGSLTLQMRNELTALNEQINSLDRTIPEHNANSTLKNSLRGLRMSIQPLLSKALSVSAAGTKPKPFTLFFTGASGVGKTTLMSDLAPLVTSYFLTDNQRKDYAVSPALYQYTKSAGKFYDGMTASTICVMFPDLFAQVDSPGADSSEAIDILMLCGTNPYKVPMAECSAKKDSYVQPSVVLGATNVRQIDGNVVKSLRNPEAVARRMDEFCFKITVAPEFKQKNSDMLDFSKLLIAKKTCAFPNSHIFQAYSMVPEGTANGVKTVKAEGPKLSTLEFLNVLHNKIVDHLDSMDCNRAGLASTMSHTNKILPDNTDKLKSFKFTHENLLVLPQVDERGWISSEYDTASETISKYTKLDLQKKYNKPTVVDELAFDTIAYVNYLENDKLSANLEWDDLDTDLNELVSETVLFGDLPTSNKTVLAIRKYLKLVDEFGDRSLIICEDISPFEEKLFNSLNYIDAITLDKLSKLEIDDSIFSSIMSKWDNSRSYFYNVYIRCLEKAKGYSSIFSAFLNKSLQSWHWFSNIKIFGCSLYSIVKGTAATLVTFQAVSLFINFFSKFLGKESSVPQGTFATLNLTKLQLKQPAREFIDSRRENACRLKLRIHFKNGNIEEINGQNGFFIMTTIVATPKHFLRTTYYYCNNPCVAKVEVGLSDHNFHGNSNYFIINNKFDSDVIVVDFPEDNELYAQDITLLKFPDCVMKRTDVRKYMPSNEGAMNSIINGSSLNGVFVVQNVETETAVEKNVSFSACDMSISYNMPSTAPCSCCGELRPYPDILRKSYCNVMIMRGVATLTGDCGGIGYIDDPNMFKLKDLNSKHPLIAYMHSAMGSDRAFGVKLRRQNFNFLDSHKNIDSPSFVERVEMHMSDVNKALDKFGIPPYSLPVLPAKDFSGFPCLKPVASFEKINISGKSSLNKTPAAKHSSIGKQLKVLSKDFKPALLHPQDTRNPYKTALLPYGANNSSGSSLRMKLVSDILSSHDVSTLKPNCVPSKLTLDQVVCGIDGEINGFNRKSSNGFVHKCISEHVKKYFPEADFSAHGMWGTDEYVFGSMPEQIFRHCYEENCARLEKGQRMLNVSTPSLKDELVSKEKLLGGKTRLFLTLDKQYLAAKKTYTSSFAKAVQDSRDVSSCQIGTNMYTESDRLYHTLRSYGNKALCLDFAKFDKRMLNLALRHYGSVERKYYELKETFPEEDLARETLLEELHPIYLVVGEECAHFCQVQNVTNSGDYMTAIMNSYASKYLIILFCVKILIKYKYGCSDFDTVDLSVLTKVTKEVIENVYVATYGDDSITVPNVKYLRYFSADRMAEAAISVGMQVTNEGEDLDELGYVDIENVTFLGRKLRVHEINHVLVVDAPLRTESIWKRVCFHKDYFSLPIEQQKLEEVLKEATLHGREYFDMSLRIVKSICKEVYKYTLDVTDYETYYCMIKSSDYGFYENYSAYKFSNKEKFAYTPLSVAVGPASSIAPSPLDTLVCNNLNNLYATSSAENDGLIDMSLNYIKKCEEIVPVVVQMDSGGRTDSHVVAPETTSVWCDKESTTCYIESGGMSELKVKELVHENSIASQTVSISQFMGRPQLISTVIFTTSSVQNDNLLHVNINDVLKNNLLFSQKTAGFGLIRGVAKIRIELNASPFHQFLIKARYVPNVAQREVFAPGITQIYDRTLTSKLQQPGMYITADDKVATMDFPYVGTTPFTPTNYATSDSGVYSDWGRLSLDVALPLQTGTGGTTDISLSIFISFENVELSNPVVPQMNTNKVKKNSSVESIPLIKEGTGPLSTGLMGVSSVAKGLSFIPTLAPAMSTVSWVARAAASLASYFGFSNPPPDQQHLVGENLYYYTASAEGMDTSAPLGVMYDNAITIKGVHSIVDKDEMSFNYLFSIPNYMATFTFTNTNIAGDVLYSSNVSPLAYYQSVNSTYSAKTLQSRQGGPLYYFGRLFNKYRGSLKVKVKFAKTVYHTGKLLITFTAASTPVTTTLNNSAYLFRTIVDLSEQDEFEIELPHLKQIPWLRTTDQSANPIDYLGLFEVRVLNALRSPPTVSTAISAIMTLTAGPDFEFAVPSVSTIPTVPVVPQMNTLPTRAIGDAEIKPASLDIDCTTVGERISSLKMLFNRVNLFTRSSAPGSSLAETMYPHILSSVTIDTTNGNLLCPNLYGDVLSYGSLCFGFFGGSMRILSLGDSSTAQVINSSNQRTLALAGGFGDTGIYDFGPLQTGALPITTPANRMTANGVTLANRGGAFYVKSPYYCSTSRSYALPNTNRTRNIALRSEPESCITWFSGSNSIYRSYARAGGEDYTVSYFLCCPPVFHLYA